jgi:hypothetical protein
MHIQALYRLVKTRSEIAIQTFTFIIFFTIYARNNAQVVTNLQQTCSNAVRTTCQQDAVFVLLVPSLLTTCQWLVDNLLQGC